MSLKEGQCSMNDYHASRIPSQSISLSHEQLLALLTVCTITSLSVFAIRVWCKDLPLFLKQQFISCAVNTSNADDAETCIQYCRLLRGCDFKLYSFPKAIDMTARTDYPSAYGMKRLQIDNVEDDELQAISRAETDTYLRAFCNAMWDPPLEILICALIVAYLIAVVTGIIQEIAQLGFGVYVIFSTIVYCPISWCFTTLIIPATSRIWNSGVRLLRMFADIYSWISYCF